MATTARDIMQTDVVTIGRDDPLDLVQRLFFEEEIHGAPVVDEEGAVVGILTSMDLVRHGAQWRDRDPGPTATAYLADLLEYSGSDRIRRNGDGDDLTASDIMSGDPICVDPNTSVRQVAELLCENRIHRLLVVEDTRLCGIISTTDLVALLAAPE